MNSRNYHISLLLSLIVCFGLLPDMSQARGLIRDAEIESHIRDVSDPILQAAGIKPESVRIFIINDPSINAFVAGENNMFLHTGLLRASGSIDMLAGVIAHETGHIAGGHLALGAEQLKKARIGTILTYILGAAAAAAGGGGEAAAAILSAGQNVTNRNFLSFTRAHEQYADQAALNYMQRAGISANGMLEILETLRREQNLRIGDVDPYTLTHPLSQSRISHIRNYIRAYPDVAGKSKLFSATNIRNHKRMQAKLAGFLDNPSETLRKDHSRTNDFFDNYKEAIALYRLPDLDSALKKIDVLLRDYPKDPYLHELKGQILFENGKIDGAVASYEKADSLAPDETLIKMGYGQALLSKYRRTRNQDDINKTVSILEEVAHSDNSLSLNWKLLSEAYGHKNKRGHMFLAMAEGASLRNDHEVTLERAERALKILQKNSPSSPAYFRAKDLRDFAKAKLDS